MMNDSQCPFIPETSIFFSAINWSIILLLPIVPIKIAPLAGYSIFLTTSDLIHETLRTSSPRSLAARITPFQSDAST